MDWYTAATMLEKLRQAGTPCTKTDCGKIPTIPYFENLFPNLASKSQENFSPSGYTPSATQTLYFTEVIPNGNDWTTTQLDIDTFSPMAAHASINRSTARWRSSAPLGILTITVWPCRCGNGCTT